MIKFGSIVIGTKNANRPQWHAQLYIWKQQ